MRRNERMSKRLSSLRGRHPPAASDWRRSTLLKSRAWVRFFYINNNIPFLLPSQLSTSFLSISLFPPAFLLTAHFSPTHFMFLIPLSFFLSSSYFLPPPHPVFPSFFSLSSLLTPLFFKNKPHPMCYSSHFPSTSFPSFLNFYTVPFTMSAT